MRKTRKKIIGSEKKSRNPQKREKFSCLSSSSSSSCSSVNDNLMIPIIMIMRVIIIITTCRCYVKANSFVQFLCPKFALTYVEFALKVHSPFCRPKIVSSMNPIVY